ncbi:MAG: hypothetical protein CMH57_06975 [Myxococcales bacterium]|nr:hypothetical protein [Myxococcales bacterium]
MKQLGEVGKVLGSGVEMMQEAQSAPGTDELRGAGCDVAMVITPEILEKFIDVVKDMDTKGFDEDGELPKDTAMVICTLNETAKVTCDDAARAYIKAVKPDHNMMVTVNRQGQEESECQKQYTPDFK